MLNWLSLLLLRIPAYRALRAYIRNVGAEVNDQRRRIGELQDAIRDIDAHARFEAHNHRLNGLGDRVDALERLVDAHARFDAHNRRVDALERYQAEHRDLHRFIRVEPRE